MSRHRSPRRYLTREGTEQAELGNCIEEGVPRRCITRFRTREEDVDEPGEGEQLGAAKFLNGLKAAALVTDRRHRRRLCGVAPVAPPLLGRPP